MLYVRGKPASHRGADCCDYTKNKTRKNIKIVLHHYEKTVTHRETRV